MLTKEFQRLLETEKASSAREGKVTVSSVMILLLQNS